MGDTEHDNRNLAVIDSAADLAIVDPAAAASLDPEILRIRADIAATRLRVSASINQLHEEVTETFDWKRHARERGQKFVKEHPWQTVAMAFAIGFLMGSG